MPSLWPGRSTRTSKATSLRQIEIKDRGPNVQCSLDHDEDGHGGLSESTGLIGVRSIVGSGYTRQRWSTRLQACAPAPPHPPEAIHDAVDGLSVEAEHDDAVEKVRSPMDAGLMAVLSDAERLLVAETESQAMDGLDEDEVVALHS